MLLPLYTNDKQMVLELYYWDIGIAEENIGPGLIQMPYVPLILYMPSAGFQWILTVFLRYMSLYLKELSMKGSERDKNAHRADALTRPTAFSKSSTDIFLVFQVGISFPKPSMCEITPGCGARMS